ncbi:unnamed protein product, partial [Gulo gulo]
SQGPGLTWDGSFRDFGLIPSSSSLLLLSWCSVRDTRTGREKRMVRDRCDPEPLNPQISCTGRASNPRNISEDPPSEGKARAIVCLYPSNELLNAALPPAPDLSTAASHEATVTQEAAEDRSSHPTLHAHVCPREALEDIACSSD